MYWIYALDANGSTCALCRALALRCRLFNFRLLVVVVVAWDVGVRCKWMCAWILSWRSFPFSQPKTVFNVSWGLVDNVQAHRTVEPRREKRAAIMIKMVERNFPTIIELFNRYCVPNGMMHVFWLPICSLDSMKSEWTIATVDTVDTTHRCDRYSEWPQRFHFHFECGKSQNGVPNPIPDGAISMACVGILCVRTMNGIIREDNNVLPYFPLMRWTHIILSNHNQGVCVCRWSLYPCGPLSVIDVFTSSPTRVPFDCKRFKPNGFT